MPGFVIANVTWKSQEQRAAYKAGLARSGHPREFGGEVVVSMTKEPIVKEGSWKPVELLVLKFPDVQSAQNWYESAAYRSNRDIRWQGATAEIVIGESDL